MITNHCFATTWRYQQIDRNFHWQMYLPPMLSLALATFLMLISTSAPGVLLATEKEEKSIPASVAQLMSLRNEMRDLQIEDFQLMTERSAVQKRLGELKRMISFLQEDKSGQIRYRLNEMRRELDGARDGKLLEEAVHSLAAAIAIEDIPRRVATLKSWVESTRPNLYYDYSHLVQDLENYTRLPEQEALGKLISRARGMENQYRHAEENFAILSSYQQDLLSIDGVMYVQQRDKLAEQLSLIEVRQSEVKDRMEELGEQEPSELYSALAEFVATSIIVNPMPGVSYSVPDSQLRYHVPWKLSYRPDVSRDTTVSIEISETQPREYLSQFPWLTVSGWKKSGEAKSKSFTRDGWTMRLSVNLRGSSIREETLIESTIQALDGGIDFDLLKKLGLLKEH